MRKVLSSLLLVIVLLGSATLVQATLRPRTAEEAIVQSGESEWSLVAFGDDSMQSIAPRYAERLQEHLGITITPKTWVIKTAQELLDLMHQEDIRKYIAAAHAIVLQLPAQNPTDFVSQSEKVCKEIVALRSPQDALIRILDAYDFSEESPAVQWIRTNRDLVQIATKFEIPVIKASEEFYGVSGGLDPVALGYLVPGVPHCPTEFGTTKLVDLMFQTGTGYGLYDCT